MIRLAILASLLFLLLWAPPAVATMAPTITPTSGVYFGPANVGLVTITGPVGSTIYYTLDGSTPTTASLVYSSSFSVDAATQVQAIAVLSGTPSTVTTSWFDVDPTGVNQISSNPASGQAINANLFLWLRADFGTTTSGANISQWGDLSSNAQIALSSSNEPTLTSGTLNGLNAVNFTPGTGGQYFSVPSSFANFATGISIFMVTRPTTLSSGAQLLSFGTGGAANAIGVSENSSFEPTFYVNNSSGTSSSVSSSTAFSTTQFQLLEVEQSGTTATLFTNGVQVGQNTSMNSLPSTSPTTNYIGQSTAGGSLFQGQVAELLVYDAVISGSARAAVESYLMQKYQITTQSPTAPVISVGSGTLSGPTRVAISAQPNSTIYYSTTGAVTTSSPIYTGPINVYYSLTLNTMAVRGGLQSTTSSAVYTLNAGQYPAPGSGGPTLQINPTSPTVAIP